MRNPKITVLMPVYNGEKYLREAIGSILNQTFNDFEFLIINDSSTDSTREIILSYDDTRIRLEDNEKNIGLTHSLNKGLRLAKGKYVARMDADDISLPDRLEKQLAVIENNTDVSIVACWIDIIDKNNTYIGNWHADRENNSPEQIYYTLFFENCIAHSSVLFKKELALKIGGYNESFRKSQDYELWIRLSKITKIVKIKRATVIRREYDQNTSSEIINQWRLHEERLFLKNINALSLSSDKVNSRTLLAIKYNDFSGKTGKTNILRALGILNRINSGLIKTAPFFLSRKELKKCAKKRRNKVLRSLFGQAALNISNLPYPKGMKNILKFVIKSLLHSLKYFLEYVYFLFLFKKRCLRLKVSKDKKNILCIVPYMIIGGAEKVILNIASGTDQKKFSFHIVTTIPANNIWRNKFHSYFQNVIMLTKWVSSENVYKKYFRQIIKRLNIDTVLISNSQIGYKYLPQLKSEFEYITTIDILHCELSPGTEDILKWVIPYLDRRVFVSNHLKDYMVQKYKNYGIEDKYIKRLKVIHNGISLRKYSPHSQMKGKFKSRFEIPDDVKIISFIGRFSWEKNPLLFVDIAKNVITKSYGCKLKFIMAGDGADFAKIGNIISEYGIKDYFILTGNMSDNEVIELLLDTYALLVTSKIEGIPFIILEAMAMEVPVISTNVGAVNEIIKDNINGYLIDLRDNVVEQYACKILDLLSGSLSRDGLAKKTRKIIISKYLLETMVAKYQEIFCSNNVTSNLK